MKKRTWLMIVSLVLTLAVSLGSTLAYLTSEDGDVNVMTVGRVKIEQHEYERVVGDDGEFVTVDTSNVDPNYGITSSYELQEFTQFKPALPAVYQQGEVKWDEQQQLWNQVGAPGSNDLFDDSVKNVIDKFVFVENTGTTDAYYRTIIAIECPEGIADGIIHVSENVNTRFTWSPAGQEETFITLNGTRYTLKIATYNEILAPGEVSRPSLLQLYLDPKATNEDVALLGDTWEVLALSQAVQAAGFESAQAALDEAFPLGEKNANVVTWLEKLLKEEYPDPDAVEIPTTSWLDNADTSWYDSSKDEFVLNTAAELAGLAKLVNEGNGLNDKTIKLGADVDLRDHKWTPIGQTGTNYGALTYFQGNFDGQNHTISNLMVIDTNDGVNYAAGMFGFLDAGSKNNTIGNFTMDKAVVNGHHWTGAAVGYLTGTLENVKVTNSTITCTHANGDACGDKAGAVVGYVNGAEGTMKNCSAENCTVTAGRDAGQVVGGAKPSQVIDCSATNVTVAPTGDCPEQKNITNDVIGRNL